MKNKKVRASDPRSRRRRTRKKKTRKRNATGARKQVPNVPRVGREVGRGTFAWRFRRISGLVLAIRALP